MNQTELLIINMAPSAPPSILTSYFDMTTLFFALICFLVVHRWFKRPKNFPPGPRGIPILGVIPFIGSHIEQTFRDWSTTYGPVMAVRLGRKDFVILNNIDVIKQVIYLYLVAFFAVNNVLWYRSIRQTKL